MDQINSYTELEKSVEFLMNAFNNILYTNPEELVVTPTRNNLSEISSCLNKIFPDNKCIDIRYTKNYDKLYFGIRVNPVITQKDLVCIIGNDEPMHLKNYKIEFDSKLFNMELSPQELAAYTIYEVSSMVASYQIIDDLRTVIDLNMTTNDDTINLKESVHYAQLVIYAIKDSLTKLSSLVYKDSVEEYISNPMIVGLDLGEFLVSAHDTIITSEGGPKDSLRASNTSVLQWIFIMYRDMRTNSSTVMDTLKDLKTTTGSILDIEEINHTIDAINRIDATISPTVEAMELPKFFDAVNLSSVNEFSLFAGLKRNGLRSIEDYLYEAAMRIKNLETEEDAVFVMRSINTRMNILADYIYNTPGLNERERAHWEDVYYRLSALREELVKKKIWNKKQYGLFFDYNQDFGDPTTEAAEQDVDKSIVYKIANDIKSNLPEELQDQFDFDVTEYDLEDFYNGTKKSISIGIDLRPVTRDIDKSIEYTDKVFSICSQIADKYDNIELECDADAHDIYIDIKKLNVSSNESVVMETSLKELLYSFSPGQLKVNADIINKNIEGEKKIGLQKKWIDKLGEGSREAKRLKRSNLVFICSCKGLELAYDLNSKKIFGYDKKEGLLNGTITVKELLSLVSTNESSSRWYNVTESYEYTDEELEADLAKISFNENGEAVIEDVDEKIDHNKETKDVVTPDVPDSVDVTVPDDIDVNESVDSDISKQREIKDEVMSKVPSNFDITIPDDINESVFFGSESEGKFSLYNESSEACCSECGSSNITIGEMGNCTCNECGCSFSINNEGFFKNFFHKKESDKKVDKKEVDKNIKYLSDKYVKPIIAILKDEYNSNKKKWDEFFYDKSKEYADNHPDEDLEEGDYAEFNLDIDNEFDYYHGEYILHGTFFDADQMMGLDICNILENEFFKAVKPKIKELCGNEFVRIDGTLDDSPGCIDIVLKPVTYTNEGFFKDLLQKPKGFSKSIEFDSIVRELKNKVPDSWNKGLIVSVEKFDKDDFLAGNKKELKIATLMLNIIDNEDTKIYDECEKIADTISKNSDKFTLECSRSNNSVYFTIVKDPVLDESANLIEGFIMENPEMFDEEFTELVESFELDTDVLVEGAFKDFLETIKNWQTSNFKNKKSSFVSNTLSDDEYDEVKNYFEIMKKESIKYWEYHKAFLALCAFCKINPRGTIITSYNLKRGSKDGKHTLEVEYISNTKKIRLPEGIKLFHKSNIPGITKLAPQFRGKSGKGYLYDKPRIYFTIKNFLPKINKPGTYNYVCIADIHDVYVDPLVWKASQGAVYVETDNPVPVKQVELFDRDNEDETSETEEE